jgi:hypothetical protein
MGEVAALVSGAVSVLRRGGLLAFRCETAQGVGADAVPTRPTPPRQSV